MTIADGADTTHLNNLSLVNDLLVSGNATITGTLTTTGAISDGSDIVLANGKALETALLAGNTALLKAYDVDGAAYKTFLTLTANNTPSMAIAAPSGGTVTIDGSVIGGTTPAAATVTTLNGNTVTAGTGTLTLQGSAVVTGPATTGTVALIAPPPQTGGSTLAVSAIMSGKPILLDTAGGTTATLPAATGSGNKYKFVVSVSTTSAAHKILANSVSDFIIGNAYGYTGSTAKVFGSAAATNHSIQMPNAGSQPSGGIIGDVFDFVDIGANLWHCIGFYQAGTTPTTPFSSATT